jgi:catechol 2,3-dioxygenase-like lactoylglutathione lyase family enzyme
MRVDHLAIAVHDMEAALGFFRRTFPTVPGHPPSPGHTGDYLWTDFQIGRFKLEIVASAKPGSFVERFLARRGEGLHHLSIEVPDFEERVADLEHAGVRVVDRFEDGPDVKTAFISPKSAFGVLIQFWKQMHPPTPAPAVVTAEYGGTPVRMRVNHVAIAVHVLDPALAFFRRFFPVMPGTAPRVGYEPSFRFTDFTIGGYKLELIAENPDGPPGFLRRFLAKRGEGFHHVSIDVDRLAPVLAQLERDGVRITDRARGPHGHETAFIAPRSAFGVLIQFWEHPEILAGADG